MDEILCLIGQVEIQAGGDQGKKPRISILAYTGGAMSVPGWPSVVIDLAGADVSGEIPLLAGHGENLDDLVGEGQAAIRNQQLYVEGTLTEATTAGRKVIALAKAGINLQASIGFAPDKREHLSAGTKVSLNGRTLTAGSQGLTVIRSGRLRETSLVLIGADPDTQVRIAAKAASQKRGSSHMETDNDSGSTVNDQADHLTAAWDGPGLSDAERVKARWNTTSFVDEHLRGEAQDLMLRATAGQLTFSDFDREVTKIELRDSRLQTIRAERPKPPPIAGRHDRLSSTAVLEGSLLAHLGHEAIGLKALGADVMQQARELRANSLYDILRAALRLEGRDEPAGRDGLIRAAFSTASLPNILGNVANKLLLSAYAAFPSAARMIARKLSANDFKSHTGVRLTGDSVMKPLGASGELAHGTLTDAAFTFSLGTFGRIFGLTRQNVINDDLSAFNEVPRMLGRGAAVALEEVFWKLVLANTGTFFGSGNGNYISGATTTLDLVGLGLGVQMFLKMVDQDGNPINVVPRYLVVPPELKAAADALYRSTTIVLAGSTDAKLPGSNTFFGLYEPVVSPYLSNSGYSGYSAVAWYLFGDPADVAAFGIAYLDGQESPVIEQVDAGPDVLGISWRGYFDFGICQIDPRGGVKSKACA